MNQNRLFLVFYLIFMPYAQAPNRFSSTNQPKLKNHGHKGPYLVPLLKKMLNKKINIEDPETQAIVKATVKDALLWRLILNGTQGETKAIVEILDRIDGKVPQPISQDLDIQNADQYFKQIADAIIQSDTNTNRLL